MGQAMIEVRDLTKTFGAVEAVRGISFRVDMGEIVGFLGPNGAGKTTTLRILAGIFPPTSGEVRIAGRDPARDPLACRRAVGYFPEYAPFYPDLRVAGYLRFVARMKRLPRAERAGAVAQVLAWCGLEGVAGRRVGTLSKGYRARAGRVGRRQRVALGGDGPPEAVATALAALPGVERVAREAAAFVLEAAASADVARAAGEAMAARGWTIRELREEMPDLEQIFLRLVRDGERPQA